MPDADLDSPSERAEAAELLAATVQEAGALAKSLFGTELKTWVKGASSPVSEADIAVNDLIENRLRPFSGSYGWLSEESTDDPARLERSLTWVVDPIDGTRAFLNKQKDWTISVALVRDGCPVLACVYAPVTDEFFFAERGRGSTLNASAIRATQGAALDLTRIAGPKSILERIAAMAEGASGHPRIGSLALRLCRVADGALDVAFAGGNSRDWDLAAADLIVHEAGGAMTELTGTPLRYNQPNVTHGILIAAGQARHRTLVDALGKAAADKPVF